MAEEAKEQWCEQNTPMGSSGTVASALKGRHLGSILKDQAEPWLCCVLLALLGPASSVLQAPTWDLLQRDSAP